MTTVPVTVDELLERHGVPAELARQAFAHRSYCAEHPGQPSNERLELLGDSVLGLVVTDHLFRAFPDLPEGDLARVRAAVVSEIGLAPVARALGLGDHLLVGRGEEGSGGREKDSLLVDALEALIGAIYLSGGIEAAAEAVTALVVSRIGEIVGEARRGDPKNQLQELAAHLGLGAPTYLLSERGPDHAKWFSAAVCLAGATVGEGEGRSKKEAERKAAEAAVARIEAGDGPERGVAPGA